MPHHCIDLRRFLTIKALADYFRRAPFRGQRRVMNVRWRRFVGWRIRGLPINADNRRRLQLSAEHSNVESGYKLRLRRSPGWERWSRS